MTNKVYACIDGLANTAAVIDWAAWSALRMSAPLEFLHVLEAAPTQAAAAVSDYSGAIGLGAQDSLLHELSELDAQRARLAQEAGRRLLTAARERAAAAGVAGADARLRQGELAEAAAELQAEARLFVLGEHQRRARPGARLHLDHHVERLIRVVQRPVLVVSGDGFAPPQRFVIAFDGSATARKTVDMVAGSPLLAGLPALIVMAGADTQPARGQLEAARQQLAAAGFAEVQTALLPGEPEDVLPPLLKAQADALLVMGAYGHSRIRQFIVGSTTTTLLRSSELPVLVLR